MPMWEEPAAMNMWAVAILSIAFDCEYMYNAVLGVAALHMFSIYPGDVTLRAAACRYINETIRGRKEELEGLDRKSSIQLFTAAILLTMCAKLISKCPGSGSEVYELPLNYFYLQIGGNDMWDWMKGDLVESGVGDYVQCMALKDMLPPTPSSRDGEPRLDFPYDAFLDTWYLDPLLSEERRGVFSGAIECLVKIKESIRKGEQLHLVHKRHSIVPSEVPRGFLALLKEEDQLRW